LSCPQDKTIKKFDFKTLLAFVQWITSRYSEHRKFGPI
jgi:hypothetical protein